MEERLQLLKDVESAAREFVRHGLRLTPEGLIVRETADKSDPYCKLCDALEAVDERSKENVGLRAENERLRSAIQNYLAVFDRCGGSESVAPKDFADARAGLRSAFEHDRAERAADARDG